MENATKPVSKIIATILLALLSPVLCATAQITNVTFTWDAQPVEAYRFYDVLGTNRTLLGSVATNRFTVTNWNVLFPRTVTVTASNMLGEGPQAPPLMVPPAPIVPTGLKPVPLSLVVPVPSTIQLSYNLVDWVERIFLKPATNGVEWTCLKRPTAPMMYLRLLPPPPQPPVPLER